ncbi:MAG: bifunctional 4-hydroxy-2-oxoglutarate aldolase/2-dehydro-3-deoxy-phosphogluconate aldolase [Bryobacteraceae bacterium]|jgi:2-dehydro-3-deoxyphosphogluconate aldolase/(4S)-4-hydroxy-2-oxoglutarate aldolase
MKKAEVRARIEEIGIIPGIRVSTPERARFAAEMVNRAGIPIAEITMTVPRALDVISHLAKTLPDMAVGAGTVLDAETAWRCLDAGATFLTSTGLVLEVVEFALKHDLVVFPGAMTPTDVIAAWKTGADFVKVFPCGPLGGPAYIQSLKLPFPQVPMIATGGVNQRTAGNFILAGATALGIGAELINPEALPVIKEEQVQELARRYLGMVKAARAQKSAR